MIGQRHEQARLQSDFYRDCYHKMLRLLLIEVGVMLLLILAIIYIILFEVKPLYYATTTSGQIIQLADVG
jgi:hypothetical protein